MHAQVQDYYGRVLRGSNDLKTDVCSTASDVSSWLRTLLSNVHEEVLQRYYGCGLIAPALLQGARVLDLGCGSGRDCYVLSQLVGPDGAVVGIDMTQEQIAVAKRHVEHHMRQCGYVRPNVDFHLGFIENLRDLGLESASFDVIVSNCVLNLSPDKPAVLREAHRLLKPGGEFYFSDVYADRRVPAVLLNDPVLYGECLSGALYWNDFLNLARAAGFADPRLVTSRPVALQGEIAERIGHIRFFSATYRLFKIADLEPACEDYGQAVVYKGTIAHHPERFVLDAHHVIEAGRVIPVCGNTYRMLHQTRFAPHFEFHGGWRIHYGIFAGCGTSIPFDSSQTSGAAASGCC